MARVTLVSLSVSLLVGSYDDWRATCEQARNEGWSAAQIIAVVIVASPPMVVSLLILVVAVVEGIRT